MLKIIIPPTELYDASKNEFFYVDRPTEIMLEHSLISISKWESKWNKPFLEDKEKTKEEILYYINCMLISKNIDDRIIYCLTEKNINDINDYINRSMTATTIKDSNEKSKKIVTSELIYGWMVLYNIPFDCEKWHLNRLITLIKVCEELNSPNKKMNKKDALSERRRLNQLRKKQLHTRG